MHRVRIMREIDSFEDVDLVLELSGLSLIFRAHGLTGPPHVNRIVQLRLARADQPLVLERLPLSYPRCFELDILAHTFPVYTARAHLLEAVALQLLPEPGLTGSEPGGLGDAVLRIRRAALQRGERGQL